jgi:prepilin-type N-terminal cleavage/methylation domain-containing protein
MRHKKFKAFTLLELLVGMILSGIVLTATFTAYRITTKQYETYSSKSKAITEISFFVSRLQADFSNATTIIQHSENSIQLQSEKRMLEYRFTAATVLRNDFNRIDTFNVSVSGMEALYKSEKVNTADSEIDELQLQINFEGKTEKKVYLKTKNPKAEIDKAEAEFN